MLGRSAMEYGLGGWGFEGGGTVQFCHGTSHQSGRLDLLTVIKISLLTY